MKTDNSHISGHFIQGTKGGQHAISQQVKVDGKTMISYTDVSQTGKVMGSGFDKKR